MRISFIGGGNMAAALIGGLQRQSRQGAELHLQVAENNPDRRQWLEKTYALAASAEAAEVLDCDVLVLAVKPQILRDVLQALPPLPARVCVLSVAAGVRAADIARWLNGHAAVVRAMPNTPALIGAGISGLFALPGVNDEQKELAARILAAAGEIVWVDNEAQIDAVTAISGSGPAYVFLMIEALDAAAKSLGLSPETARKLSLHTFYGASALALQDGSEPAELRARVTSKGGTTERGILALEAADVRAAIQRAAQAASARAKELGDLLGAD